MRGRLALGLAATLALSAVGARAAPPNVVVILADDLGWADVGYHGGPIETPSIDRLASEGVQLDRFYTAPMCTPTRAMLMTGRDPMRMGLAYEQINPWNNAGVPPDEHFMPESFRAAGYQTAMVGKWHLGHAIGQHHPNARGFDYYYGHLNTAIDYWTHSRRKALDWQRNGTSVDERGRYATDLQGEDAARVIRTRDKSKPLFLYVAFNAPHNPMQAPQELIDKYAHLAQPTGQPGYLAALGDVPPAIRERYDRFRVVYAAMVHSMDRAVGLILDALDEEGIAGDTIVLFSSDNGGFNIFGADNTPLRGQKAQSFEGGIRVTAALRWPGRLPAGEVVGQVVTAMDVFPTLAGAAGVEPRSHKPLDGENLWGQIQSGESTPRDRDLLFVSEVPIPGQIFWGVIRGPWKLVRIERPGSLPTLTYLFNIREDPFEQSDVAAEHPDRVAALESRLAEWRSQHPANGLRRSPGPHPGWLPPEDWSRAMLPADDVRPETVSDFLQEGVGDQSVNVLLYRAPGEGR